MDNQNDEITPDDAWVTAGTQVFVRGHQNIGLGVIAKVTARDIVLESGSRYSRRSRSRSLSSYEVEVIVPTTDPRTRTAFRRQVADRTARLVALAAEKFAAEPTETLAAAVELALTKWREAESKINV